ncbi:hypothetical protein SAMN05216323_10943 [Williamwhitmania taraxaci]|uniref:Uncharacterized protein n=1 Tax=Williamwhitmania taraxaci TaxID=1640674 RepID=A0A1G6SG83_9BACT|nr:hypothetical protein SAMN05216323_10943 [Williamwhitmania taraxaci]
MKLFKTPHSKKDWFVKGLFIGVLGGLIGAIVAFMR